MSEFRCAPPESVTPALRAVVVIDGGLACSPDAGGAAQLALGLGAYAAAVHCHPPVGPPLGSEESSPRAGL